MVTVPQGAQNPAYALLSAHHPRFEFSFVVITLLEGTIMEQLAEKTAVGARLTVSLSSTRRVRAAP